MAQPMKAPRGTQDVLPKDSFIWQYIEQTCLQTAHTFGYRELRTPTFEHTELFQRGVGDTTDVVEKEMYTFLDKSDRSLTLRPEGTAGTVRASLESGIINDGLPLKASYITSCFRYDKPQAGRLREFHQFGVENFGPQNPAADVEIISLAHTTMEALGLQDVQLKINSIGCPTCRKAYHEALQTHLQSQAGSLCTDCQNRLERNPLRVLDCKIDGEKEVVKTAPRGIDYLCAECKDHFAGVQKGLDSLGIPYEIDSNIVRGLDYYTKTVFEFVSDALGAQSTVCGGGRYDGLVEILGGKPTPAVGFGMGLERLILILKAQNAHLPQEKKPALYIASAGEKGQEKALELATQLRKAGAWVEFDVMDKSTKGQMKYADKIGAKYAMVLGDTELATNSAEMKNMETGDVITLFFEDIITYLL